MKRLKFLLLFLIICVFTINILFSTTNKVEPIKEKIKVFVPKAPPALPFIKTAESENIEIIYYNDLNTEVLPIIFKDKNYLFVLPLNIGAKLKIKGEDLVALNILSKGMIYLLSSKASVIKEIEGEECGIGAPGSSPDVISKYIFTKKNITITPRYGDSTEIAKLMIASKINHAVLPEPLASLVLNKNKNVKRILNFTEEWKKENDINLIPQTALFGYKDFIRKNKKIIDNILKKYDESILWIDNNLNEMAEKGIKELELSLDIETMKSAIKFMNLSSLRSSQIRKDIEKYLKILNEIDSNSTFDKLPDESFYY